MGLLSALEVKEFISKLRNPEKLLTGCIKFHELEPRDIIYLVARKIILENPTSEYGLLAGIEVLLLTWNAVYLQRQPRKVRERLEDDILVSYGDVVDDFEFLKEKKLDSVKLTETETANAINRIFKSFASRKSIERTGTSKAIHLILPELFMMWDDEIRRHYHKLHPSYRIRSESIAECYVEFMKNSQHIARALLEKKSIKEMQKAYFDKVYAQEPQLPKVFSSATKISLPKMLDECNYMRFRKRVDF